MERRIFLESGHLSTGSLEDIDEIALAEANKGSVLALNLTEHTEFKLNAKQALMRSYFLNMGAANFELLSADSSEEEIARGFEGADLLYLPGGETKRLSQNIREMKLAPWIMDFGGVIVGNSAGAGVLCPYHFKVKDKKLEVGEGLGAVDFNISVHYALRLDPTFKRTLEGRDTYALQDESAIVYTPPTNSRPTGNRQFIGDIWRFSNNKKERVN